MKIESRIGKSEFPAEKVFTFISDFRNFNNFIPVEQISDWTAEKDHCSFRMDLIGTVKLLIVEKEENALIKISSDPSAGQYNFNLWIQLKSVSVKDTRIKITIEPLLSAFMLPMVKKPLKSFVDSLVDEIEKFNFATTDPA